MKPNLQHAIERVERPGGSHEGVGRKKRIFFHRFVLRAAKWSCIVEHVFPAASEARASS